MSSISAFGKRTGPARRSSTSVSPSSGASRRTQKGAPGFAGPLRQAPS